MQSSVFFGKEKEPNEINPVLKSIKESHACHREYRPC